ncbi:MAG: hypothetical protein OZ921_15355 [Sorangiineae bacterium]|nr:hypothetical protein [Polyangiaceae bacterium]MEB2323888.1 hypothetical protein [Sorangiineae bacterium]
MKSTARQKQSSKKDAALHVVGERPLYIEASPEIVKLLADAERMLLHGASGLAREDVDPETKACILDALGDIRRARCCVHNEEPL